MTKMSSVSVDPRSIEIPKRPANKSASEHRKATKPIMEKRRRARINQSLNQLKNMLLEHFKQPEAKAQKLEKADILEMTVQYLQRLQSAPQQPEMLYKFQAGFRQCRVQVDKCFRKMQLQPALADRLTSHLADFEQQQLVQLSESTPLNLSVDPRQPLNLTITSNAASVNSPPPSPTGSISTINSSGSYNFPNESYSPNSECSISPVLTSNSADLSVWRPW